MKVTWDHTHSILIIPGCASPLPTIVPLLKKFFKEGKRCSSKFLLGS